MEAAVRRCLLSRGRSPSSPPSWRQLLGFDVALGDRARRSSATPSDTGSGRRSARTRRRRPGPTRTTSRSSWACSWRCSAGCSGSASSATRCGGCSAARRRCASARSTAPGATSGSAPTTRSSAIQYLVAVLFFFFVAGLNAMFIRGELTSANATFIPAGNYLTLVGLHGTMMLMMMSAGVLGPLGNYLVPLMIGARRMAFPRIEALTTVADRARRLRAALGDPARRLPDRLDRLRAARRSGARRHRRLHRVVRADRHLARARRAEHDRDRGDDARAGHDLEPAADLRLGTGHHVDPRRAGRAGAARRADHGDARPHDRHVVLPRQRRVAPRSCGTTCSGSSATRRSTSSRCPGSGSCSRSCPCSRASRCGATGSRSPACSASRCSASWSGSTTCSSAASTRTCGRSTCSRTELISIPTGLIFLNAMGTLWRARIRFTVPMLFALAFFFNFLIGGLSGVFLSDVPSDVTTHGSYFVMAHFHYTIMGGLVFALMAGLYYWLPKMTGLQAQRDARQGPLLDDVRVLQPDLLPAVRRRAAGHAAARLELQRRAAHAQRVRVDRGLLPRRVDAASSSATSSGR